MSALGITNINLTLLMAESACGNENKDSMIHDWENFPKYGFKNFSKTLQSLSSDHFKYQQWTSNHSSF